MTIHNTKDSKAITAEGRFAGPWVAELGRPWAESVPRLCSPRLGSPPLGSQRLGSPTLLLDMRSVTFRKVTYRNLTYNVTYDVTYDVTNMDRNGEQAFKNIHAQAGAAFVAASASLPSLAGEIAANNACGMELEPVNACNE